jgi:hypothetical protein
MEVRIMAYSESFKKQAVKKVLSPGIVINDINTRGTSDEAACHMYLHYLYTLQRTGQVPAMTGKIYF